MGLQILWVSIMKPWFMGVLFMDVRTRRRLMTWSMLIPSTGTKFVVRIHSEVRSLSPFQTWPSLPLLSLVKQTQPHRERRSGGHVWKGYKDYKVATWQCCPRIHCLMNTSNSIKNPWFHQYNGCIVIYFVIENVKTKIFLLYGIDYTSSHTG